MSQETETVAPSGRPFRLGDWLVEPSLNRLSKGKTTTQLELKVMDVLVCLAEQAGKVVTRQEIVDRVWATEYIADNTLTHAVTELRNALGDDARNPSFIETIHRRGYRLIAPIEPEVSDEAGESKVARFPVRERLATLDEERSPYPGLAAFTEADAEFFFGRENEVVQMWRKLTSRRLLAVIGPSGVGKSSFLRAGVMPAKPGGWGVLVCQPGEAPFAALARALVPEFAGDEDAISKLVHLIEPEETVAMVSRWRQQHEQALLIVDQFEELFTLSAPEAQARFAGIMRLLVDQADIHVLLSMRDDFLFRVHGHPPLAPIFEDLTPIGQPESDALERALTAPAGKMNFGFEDEQVPREMVAEVEGERGALPLLAFAVARLWDKRDRTQRLLTRQAYDNIGGVGGALARHAEATMASIGGERLPVVREIFRNLVTAEGTRAVRDWDELLSIFSDSRSESPEEVLRELINARLLTSYEVREGDEEPTRRVEIIHESLLANWPRLVGWQTQDADSVRLRDELRQAARTWDEHDRTDDLLWSGSTYREFAVWRERYPGGLTEIEGDFSSAMTSHAKRSKRRRLIAVASVLVIAAVVTAVTTVLWRRSVLQERRAEAQKLIALGHVRLEDYPTAALANATRSLELADSKEARILAMEALWEGPTTFIVNETPSLFASFSRGGDWLVQSHDFMSSLAVISRDGVQKVMDHPSETGTARVRASFSGAEDIFPSMGWDSSERGRIALWSASEGRLLATATQIDEFEFGSWGGFAVIDGDAEKPRAISAMGKEDLVTVDALHIDGSHERLGEFRLAGPPGQFGRCCLDQASGAWLAVVEDNEVSVLEVEENGLSNRRLLGRQEGERIRCVADPLGRFFLTINASGEIRRWDPSNDVAPADFKLPAGVRLDSLSKDGSYLLAWSPSENGAIEHSFWSIDEAGLELLRRFNIVDDAFAAFDPVGLRYVRRGPIPAHRLWSLAAPAGAEPILLRRGPASYSHVPEFSPDGRWLATNDQSGLIMWPLVRSYPTVIGIDLKPYTNGLEFGPDGRFLATAVGSEVRVWPLVGRVPPAGRVVFKAGPANNDLAVSPDGELFAVGNGISPGAVWIGRDGEEPLELSGGEGLAPGTGLVAFSQDGRFLAAAAGGYDIANATFHVWEVATGKEVAVLRLDGEEFRGGSSFTGDGRLVTGSTKGVLAWDIETGEHEVLVEVGVQRAVANNDGRRLLVTEEGEGGLSQDPAGSPSFFDLDTAEVTTLTTHGLQVRKMALNQEGSVAVTGDANGVIRVGPVTGEEPHLLLGHDSQVLCLAIDPLGRWIASGALDQTVRLWPMPDLTKPPLHTLPREELIAKLKTLTNLRVVRDEESPSGWKLTHDPFPGWETVPEW